MHEYGVQDLMRKRFFRQCFVHVSVQRDLCLAVLDLPEVRVAIKSVLPENDRMRDPHDHYLRIIRIPSGRHLAIAHLIASASPG